ncbi:MAG: glycosyltransferase family 2 protein [Solirubrobacterales bacterium]
MPDVILPVLDEAGALPGVLGSMPQGYRAIVVDNGSTDGSGQIARDLGATVVNEPAKGFGSACFAGLLAAEAEVICFMDCDGSLDPADLVKLESELKGGSDLVIGSRDAERGAWPPHARIANRVLAFELRRRTGMKVKDLGPMRVMYRQPLLELGMVDRRSGWPLEMVIKAHAAGWKLTEVPVKLHPRSGRSKVTGTVKGTLQAIRDMSSHLRGIP